nr:hypothetical protein [Tanacetum cinerariifolium]
MAVGWTTWACLGAGPKTPLDAKGVTVGWRYSNSVTMDDTTCCIVPLSDRRSIVVVPISSTSVVRVNILTPFTKATQATLKVATKLCNIVVVSVV